MAEKLLTNAELELMNIVWDLKEASVRMVMDELPEDRKLAYTSVSTILRILEKKQILKSKKEGKTHIYIPMVEKEEYEKKETGSLVKNLFGGSKLSLVKCLIDSEDLSDEELGQLKQLIEERTK
jgi:predicted transcriptional regulator